MDLPSLPGERLVAHGGDLDPFCSFLIIDPARSLGVFVMVNSVKGMGSFSLGGIAAEALRTFGQAKGGPSFASPAPGAHPRAPARFDLASRLVGNYATSMGLVRIREKGSVLAIQAFGKWLEGYYRTDGSIGSSREDSRHRAAHPDFKGNLYNTREPEW